MENLKYIRIYNIKILKKKNKCLYLDFAAKS